MNDDKFIIPLRLEPFKKLLGIGGLQYVDFVRGWATGLENLLETLKRRKVPCDPSAVQINPNWELYRRRGAIPILQEPERLTSNWLRVANVPSHILFYETAGSVDRPALAKKCDSCPFPVEPRGAGFLCFADQDEVDEAFGSIAKFKKTLELPLTDFIQEGSETLGLRNQDASRSCPVAWCSCGGVITALSGMAGLVRRPQRAG